MKKYLICMISLALSLAFMNCLELDVGVKDQTSYLYINKSRHLVAISAITNNNTQLDAAIKDSVILPGDTIQFLDKTFPGLTGPFLYNSNHLFTITLLFDEVNKRCLVFDGSIEDEYSDIRSSLSYEVEDLGKGRAKRFFEINDEHFSKAGICD